MSGRNKAGGHVDGEGMLLTPMMRSHVAHAMEMRAFFDRNERGPDIANKNAWFQDVNLFRGSNGAIDLAAIHEHTG